MGILSAPYVPDFAGLDRFQGNMHHTGCWPTDPVDFAGKRVAVIGTGASGVQIIPPIAEVASSVTVYQRTANWVAPLNNTPITLEEQAWIKEHRAELYEQCRSTFAGFVHPDPAKATFDDTPCRDLRGRRRS